MEPSATAFARMPRGRRPGDEQAAHGGRRTDKRGSRVRFDEVENLPSRGDMDFGVMEDSRVVDPTREFPCLLRGIRGPLGDRFVGCAADDRHDSGPGRMHPHPVQRTHVQVERDHRMAVTDQPFHHRSPDATARTRHHLRPHHGVPVCTLSAAGRLPGRHCRTGVAAFRAWTRSQSSRRVPVPVVHQRFVTGTSMSPDRTSTWSRPATPWQHRCCSCTDGRRTGRPGQR